MKHWDKIFYWGLVVFYIGLSWSAYWKAQKCERFINDMVRTPYVGAFTEIHTGKQIRTIYIWTDGVAYDGGE